MPSKDIVADGLTKALGETPLQRFRDLVGVEDVSVALQQRRDSLKVLESEDLKALEEKLHIN
jgi:hypothetical protein